MLQGCHSRTQTPQRNLQTPCLKGSNSLPEIVFKSGNLGFLPRSISPQASALLTASGDMSCKLWQTSRWTSAAEVTHVPSAISVNDVKGERPLKVGGFVFYHLMLATHQAKLGHQQPRRLHWFDEHTRLLCRLTAADILRSQPCFGKRLGANEEMSPASKP